MRQWTSARLLLLASTTAVLLLGCSGDQVESIVAGGDPDRGRVALDGFGCGACHLIPGIRGARGMVPNSPDNLVHWIQDPQAVDPETAMPDLDVVPAIAADMAAYLYTLR
jgi:hypothetical protein